MRALYYIAGLFKAGEDTLKTCADINANRRAVGGAHFQSLHT
jgi:hypothetical protein